MKLVSNDEIDKLKLNNDKVEESTRKKKIKYSQEEVD